MMPLGGRGFGGFGGFGLLTQEQQQTLNEALQNDTVLTDLGPKLTAAQKDMVNAVLDKNATGDSVKAKFPCSPVVSHVPVSDPSAGRVARRLPGSPSPLLAHAQKGAVEASASAIESQ